MKCVMVIDADLPLGLIANTSAVLAMSIGKRMPELVGNDIDDAGGCVHPGITTIPIPLLKGDREKIRCLRDRAADEPDSIFVVDFCDVAQSCNSYGDYTARLEKTPPGDLNYLGIALMGPKKQINRLTGSLGLLR